MMEQGKKPTMYGITTQAKTLIDSVTFADAIHALEAQVKLSRLQNLEITWTYSDATESNREYAAEGEKVMGELRALVEANGIKVA